MDPFGSPNPYDPFGESPTPHSVIPELAGRSPVGDEQVLIDGTEVPLSSSNVSSMSWRWGEYDATGKPVYDPRLYVLFNNGSRYQYTGVSLTTALDMMHAPSPGRFVWQKLRDQYPTEQV